MIPKSVLATFVSLAVVSPLFAQLPILPNALRIEPLGDGEGRTISLKEFVYVEEPCFSPDGKWIAFHGYKGDRTRQFEPGFDFLTNECWIVRSDGTEVRRLAVGEQPRWSPDGKRLLFMRTPEAGGEGLGLAFDHPDNEKEGVFVINADGTGEKYLFPGRSPDWSPDGKAIVFADGGAYSGRARPGSRICVARIDGTERREIANGDCPTWSPDGKLLAGCYADPALPDTMIRLVRLAGIADERLIGPGWFRANWSPDGKSLYALGDVDEDNADADGVGMVRLTLGEKVVIEPIPTEFEGYSPYPSPDGKSIVFVFAEKVPGLEEGPK